MKLPIVFNDRYQLNTKLGEGGLAEVYLAQDLALGRLVAVKLLRPEYTYDPSFLVRFHREAQSAAALNSSNVVSVYDFGQDHNRPYIIMEYVSGEDLRTVLDKGLLTVPQIVDYAIEFCNAVGMAHRRGMVHGDLKPGNILISPENKAKVTDFGLARALGESAMDDGELVWGTPAYFAPEQAAGDRVLPATDVYAIIMYEMLTGKTPFGGNSDQEIARKQLYEQPPPMSTHTHRVPPPLEAVVNKALAKDPAQRYHSADQLKNDLLQFQQGARGHTTLQPPAAYPPPSSTTGLAWPWACWPLLPSLA
ncbi:MAG: protein kinase [Anaerolineae bacterium]